MPTPLRTTQTSGHSSSYISNIPLWSLKSPPSHGSKIIILTDSGMTANSVNHYIRSVKVFLYWCMEQGKIAPFKIKMVKAQETIKDVYMQEELCALIQPPKRTV